MTLLKVWHIEEVKTDSKYYINICTFLQLFMFGSTVLGNLVISAYNYIVVRYDTFINQSLYTVIITIILQKCTITHCIYFHITKIRVSNSEIYASV